MWSASLTDFTDYSGVFFLAFFEQLNVGWVNVNFQNISGIILTLSVIISPFVTLLSFFKAIRV